jgi:hypothetical protein
MRKKPFCLIWILALIVFASGLAGCAFNRVNLVDEGVVRVERVDPETTCVARPAVYQDGDELLIRGSVKCHRFRGFSRGHIDIAIVSAEGEVLQSLSALYYPRIIPRKGGRESRFHVTIPLKPTAGAVVRLAFHKVETPSIETFYCDDNAAIPGR